VPNILDAIPPELPEEWMETLLESGGLRIERIVSRGHTTPENVWCCQETDEWVLLIQGDAQLQYRSPDGSEILKPGDWVFIPAGREHRVGRTAADRDTVWLAIHWGGKGAAPRPSPG
jgi:cupin 2 domain-containing protein